MFNFTMLKYTKWIVLCTVFLLRQPELGSMEHQHVGHKRKYQVLDENKEFPDSTYFDEIEDCSEDKNGGQKNNKDDSPYTPNHQRSYGGDMGSQAFENTFYFISKHCAALLQKGSSFDDIKSKIKTLRYRLALFTNTNNFEKFDEERGSLYTPLDRYPLMRENLICNLSNIRLTEVFTGIDNDFEYRYLSLTIGEWLVFLSKEHGTDDFLKESFLFILVKKTNKDVHLTRWHSKDHNYETDKLENIKLSYSDLLRKELYEFIGYRHESAKEQTLQEEYDITEDLFNEKLLSLAQKQNVETLYDKQSINENSYKLSLVQFRHKSDPKYFTRSIMFPDNANKYFDDKDVPFVLLHPPAFCCEYNLSICEDLFTEARDYQESYIETTRDILKFSYHWALTTPFNRGSAAVNEYLTAGLFIYHKRGLLKRSVLKKLDSYAQGSFTLDSFLKNMLPLCLEKDNFERLQFGDEFYDYIDHLDNTGIDCFINHLLKEHGNPYNVNISNCYYYIDVIRGFFNKNVYYEGVLSHVTAYVNEVCYCRDGSGWVNDPHNGLVCLSTPFSNNPNLNLSKEILERCEEAFKNALIYEDNDSVTFDKIKNYQRVFNDLQPDYPEKRIMNDYLLFRALCLYHNITPEFLSTIKLKRKTYQSHHVIASRKNIIERFEAFNLTHFYPNIVASLISETNETNKFAPSIIEIYKKILYHKIFEHIGQDIKSLVDIKAAWDVSESPILHSTIPASVVEWKGIFPNAEIIGVYDDHIVSTEEEIKKNYYADAMNSNHIKEILENLSQKEVDIIIDDGRRSFQDIKATLNNHIEEVLHGLGLYIIENIETKNIPLFLDLMEERPDFALIHLPNTPQRLHYNFLFIFIDRDYRDL